MVGGARKEAGRCAQRGGRATRDSPRSDPGGGPSGLGECLRAAGRRTPHSGRRLLVGRQDGKVKVYSGDLIKREEYDLGNTALNACAPEVVSVAGADDGAVVVGTKGGDVFHCRGDEVERIHQGHYRGEVRSVMAHPME